MQKIQAFLPSAVVDFAKCSVLINDYRPVHSAFKTIAAHKRLCVVLDMAAEDLPLIYNSNCFETNYCEFICKLYN